MEGEDLENDIKKHLNIDLDDDISEDMVGSESYDVEENSNRNENEYPLTDELA